MSELQEKREPHAGDAELVQGFAAQYDALRKEIHKVVIGQERVVEELLISLFSRGHALLLGVPLRRILIFNESIDCFYFSWRQWLELIIHRMQSRPMPQAGSKWSYSARILISLLLKSVVLPFRFFWLLLVWLRLRSAGLRYTKKNHDNSLRLPPLPGA